MLPARVASSSERVGESSTTLWKNPSALWARARTSISWSGGHLLADELDLGPQERTVLRDLQDAEALDPLHHEAQRAVREPEHLVDVGEGTRPVEVALRGVVYRGVALGDDADDLALLDRVVDEGDGALPGHREGQDGLGEEQGVPQRQDARSRSGCRSGRPRGRPPTRSRACVRRSGRASSVAGAGPQGHVHQLALQALEGLRLALGAHVALRLLLAVAAQGREGQGAQAGGRDLERRTPGSARRCPPRAGGWPGRSS